MAWHAPREFVPEELVREPCLKHGDATIFGQVLRNCEGLLGMPVEWAMDKAGARPLQVSPRHPQPIDPTDHLRRQPAGFNVHPAASRALPRVSAAPVDRSRVISRRASHACERSIPIILGMLEAAIAIHSGSPVAVAGVAGIAR